VMCFAALPERPPEKVQLALYPLPPLVASDLL
jgi:hypothetical protein